MTWHDGNFRLQTLVSGGQPGQKNPNSRFQTSKHSKHHHDHMILDLDSVGLLVMLVELKSGRHGSSEGLQDSGLRQQAGSGSGSDLITNTGRGRPYASILCPTLSSDRIELNVKEKPKQPRMSEWIYECLIYGKKTCFFLSGRFGLIRLGLRNYCSQKKRRLRLWLQWFNGQWANGDRLASCKLDDDNLIS